MKSKKQPKLTQLWPQWLASIEVSLMQVVIGSCIGWISPFLGNLSRPNPPFTATEAQTTWIASLMYLSRALGIIFGSISTNLFGSKITILYGAIGNVIGWIFLIAANSTEIVFGCLFFLGFSGGISQPVLGIYISEIAYAPIRGTLMNLANHGFMVGMLIGNILGAYLTPWVFGVLNLAITILFLITFYYFPQTPYYFVNRNELESAEMSIRWYTRTVQPNRDLENLVKFIATSPRLSYIVTLREILRPSNLKVLSMISIMFGAIEFCGIITFIEYSEIIFIKSNVTIVSPATLVTIIAAMGIPACWVAMFTTDKFGRINMLLLSCIIFSVAIGGWAVNFHLLDLGYDNSNLQWIVIISAALYRISINVGLLPVRITLMAELYAPNVKSMGNSINNIAITICIFVSSKNFLFVAEYMSYKGTFYMLSAIILLIGILIKIILPETKGKTLQEIQEMLNDKKQLAQEKTDKDDFKLYTVDLDNNILNECTQL